MSGQAFEGNELASTPWLHLLCVANSGEVCDQKCIRWIGLLQANVRLAIAGCGLWVHAEDVWLIGHKDLACRQEVGDMDAVYRGNLKSDNNSVKVLVLRHASSNHAGKLICTWLVITK